LFNICCIVFRNLKNYQTAEAIWNEIISLKDFKTDPALRMLNTNPDYFANNNMPLIISTAIRMAEFIDRYTPLIEKCYGKFNLSWPENVTLVGVILMRLQCYLLQHTVDLELPLYNKEKDLLSENYSSNIRLPTGEISFERKNYDNYLKNNMCSLNVRDLNDLKIQFTLERFKMFDNTPILDNNVKICEEICNNWQTFVDMISVSLLTNQPIRKVVNYPISRQILSNFVNQKLNSLNGIGYIYFLIWVSKLFHMHACNYFINTYQYDENVKIPIQLILDKVKFSKSCDPNTKIA